MTPTGITLPSNMTFDDWRQALRQVSALNQALPWVYGDLLNFGESKYGETYAQAMDETGLAYETLAKYKKVAARVQIGLRRPNLAFNHHVEVAFLPEDQQAEWLATAENQGLSTRELREALAAAGLRESKGGAKGGDESPAVNY